MLREKRTGWIISILIVVIIILAGVVLYSYVGKPFISGYSSKVYNQGYNQGASDALTILINQIRTRGYAEIPINNNQPLILVQVQPNPNLIVSNETS